MYNIPRGALATHIGVRVSRDRGPMTNLPELADDGHEIRAGRPSGYTNVAEWVLLAPGLSDRAVRVYGLLRMHCQGGNRAWPGQQALADMLGIKKRDAVSAAIRELVEIGAVEVQVERHTRGRRNVYTVHETPPPDYDGGPRNRTEFYDSRRAPSVNGALAGSGDGPKSGVTRSGGSPEIGGNGSPPPGGQEVLQGEVLQENLKPNEADASSSAPVSQTDWEDQNRERVCAPSPAEPVADAHSQHDPDDVMDQPAGEALIGTQSWILSLTPEQRASYVQCERMFRLLDLFERWIPGGLSHNQERAVDEMIDRGDPWQKITRWVCNGHGYPRAFTDSLIAQMSGKQDAA